MQEGSSQARGRTSGLTDPKVWIRGLFMLLFALIYSLAEVVVLAVAVFQFGTVLLTGRPNERLLEFGSNLSTYMYEIVLFFTYNTEQKPFPFDAWPSARGGPPAPLPPGS